jgi:hypothetical protein
MLPYLVFLGIIPFSRCDGQKHKNLKKSNVIKFCKQNKNVFTTLTLEFFCHSNSVVIYWQSKTVKNRLYPLPNALIDIDWGMALVNRLTWKLRQCCGMFPWAGPPPGRPPPFRIRSAPRQTDRSAWPVYLPARAPKPRIQIFSRKWNSWLDEFRLLERCL